MAGGQQSETGVWFLLDPDDPNISNIYDGMTGEAYHDFSQAAVSRDSPAALETNLDSDPVTAAVWNFTELVVTNHSLYAPNQNASTLWNGTSTTNGRSAPLCNEPPWSLYVKLACVPLFALLGLIGNTLSFIVMFSPVYHRKSYSYYLRALAVSDNLTLIIVSVALANEATYELSGRRLLDDHTAFTCKMTEFLRDVIYVISSWLIVCFTVDRYIAVCHPLKRAKLCTESGAKITMCVLVILSMTSQLYVFVYMDRVDRDNLNICHAPPELRVEYFTLRYFWFSFTVRFMAPFVIVAICNGLIMFHIKRMRKRHGGRERDRTRNASMAIYTLFVVCAVFVLTLFPNAIISVITVSEFLLFGTSALYCKLLVFNTPFKMVRLVNYSMNFVLYGMTGRQFRCEVRKLIQCRLRFSNFNDRARDLMLQKMYAANAHYAANGLHGYRYGTDYGRTSKPGNATWKRYAVTFPDIGH